VAAAERRAAGSSSLERPQGYSWLPSCGPSPGGRGGAGRGNEGFTG